MVNGTPELYRRQLSRTYMMPDDNHCWQLHMICKVLLAYCDRKGMLLVAVKVFDAGAI